MSKSLLAHPAAVATAKPQLSGNVFNWNFNGIPVVDSQGTERLRQAARVSHSHRCYPLIAD